MANTTTSSFIYGYISDFWSRFGDRTVPGLFWNGEFRNIIDIDHQLNLLYDSIGVDTVPIYWSRAMKILEVVTPAATFNPLYPFCYQLDSSDSELVYLPIIYDHVGVDIMFDASISTDTRLWETDYLVEDGKIAFKVAPTVDKYYGEYIYLDEAWLYQTYGNLIDFDRPSSFYYSEALKGVWYLYWQAPTLGKYNQGLNMLLGLPFAYKDGTVVAVTDTMIQVDDAIYNNPRKVPVAVAVGDVVTRFQPLVKGAYVADYLSDPEWFARHNLFMFDTSLNIESIPTDPDVYATCLELLKFHTFSVNVDYRAFNSVMRPEDLTDFIRDIKPIHTNFIFIIYFIIDDEFVPATDELHITINQYWNDRFPPHCNSIYGGGNYYGEPGLTYGCDGDPCTINLINSINDRQLVPWYFPKFVWKFGHNTPMKYDEEGVYGIRGNRAYDLEGKPEDNPDFFKSWTMGDEPLQIPGRYYPIEIAPTFDFVYKYQIGFSIADACRTNIPVIKADWLTVLDDDVRIVVKDLGSDEIIALDSLLTAPAQYADDVARVESIFYGDGHAYGDLGVIYGEGADTCRIVQSDKHLDLFTAPTEELHTKLTQKYNDTHPASTDAPHISTKLTSVLDTFAAPTDSATFSMNLLYNEAAAPTETVYIHIHPHTINDNFTPPRMGDPGLVYGMPGLVYDDASEQVTIKIYDGGVLTDTRVLNDW
jgi:hypothetical protein